MHVHNGNKACSGNTTLGQHLHSDRRGTYVYDAASTHAWTRQHWKRMAGELGDRRHCKLWQMCAEGGCANGQWKGCLGGMGLVLRGLAMHHPHRCCCSTLDCAKAGIILRQSRTSLGVLGLSNVSLPPTVCAASMAQMFADATERIFCVSFDLIDRFADII